MFIYVPDSYFFRDLTLYLVSSINSCQFSLLSSSMEFPIDKRSILLICRAPTKSQRSKRFATKLKILNTPSKCHHLLYATIDSKSTKRYEFRSLRKVWNRPATGPPSPCADLPGLNLAPGIWKQILDFRIINSTTNIIYEKQSSKEKKSNKEGLHRCEELDLIDGRFSVVRCTLDDFQGNKSLMSISTEESRIKLLK